MVTGASTADLAVILIDARKGVLTQTRRHSYLAHLIGIRHIVLAVNKMDLVDYDQAVVRRDRRRLSRVRERDRHHRLHRDPDLGLQGRQYHRAVGQHALVQGAGADRASGSGRGRRAARCRRRSACRCNGSTARTSTSAASRADRAADRSSRAMRCACCPAARPRTVDAHCHAGWRPGRGGCRAVGDADTVRRGRLLARRCDRRRRRRRPRSPTSSRRRWSGWPTRRCIAGRAYWLKLGTQTVSATVQQPKYRDQRQHDGASGGQDARTERHRRRRTLDRQADRVRSLCRQPHAGRLHPDRQAHQRDGRRGHAALQPAPRAECPLAGERHQPRHAREPEEPEARACCGSPACRGRASRRSPIWSKRSCTG